jgi:hypothetical protein
MKQILKPGSFFVSLRENGIALPRKLTAGSWVRIPREPVAVFSEPVPFRLAAEKSRKALSLFCGTGRRGAGDDL